jgi:hypothetical protein
MGAISYNNNVSMGSFAGVPIDYIQKMGFSLNLGSDFNQSDFDTASEVAIVNKNVIESLFPTSYPLGEKITYNNKEYTIIGTLEDSSIFGMVFIPITTYWQRISGNTDISAITIKLSAEEDNA